MASVPDTWASPTAIVAWVRPFHRVTVLYITSMPIKPMAMPTSNSINEKPARRERRDCEGACMVQ